MAHYPRAILFLFVATAFPAFLGAQKAELVVSAASSLTDVLTSLLPDAKRAVGARILFNFGASGSLRRQIEEGAPVDVFFSAASEDMDRLEKLGLIVSQSRRDLLSNALVLISAERQKPVTSLPELRGVLAAAKLLALGDPSAVPAGRYAVEALRNLGQYDAVAGKLVFGGSVREVLQYVQSGSAPLGVVFATDALAAKPGSRVHRLFDFPADALRLAIRYPVAVVAATKNPGKAGKLLAFLQGPQATDAFRKAGFIVP
jgi:molybdate transport system substrate-binding protein